MPSVATEMPVAATPAPAGVKPGSCAPVVGLNRTSDFTPRVDPPWVRESHWQAE